MKLASLAILGLIMASGLATSKFLQANEMPNCVNNPVLKNHSFWHKDQEYKATFTQSSIGGDGYFVGEGYNERNYSQGKRKWSMKGNYNKETNELKVTKRYVHDGQTFQYSQNYDEDTCEFKGKWYYSDSNQGGDVTMGWGPEGCGALRGGVIYDNAQQQKSKLEFTSLSEGCNCGFDTCSKKTFCMFGKGNDWQLDFLEVDGEQANGIRQEIEMFIAYGSEHGTWINRREHTAGKTDLFVDGGSEKPANPHQPLNPDSQNDLPSLPENQHDRPSKPVTPHPDDDCDTKCLIIQIIRNLLPPYMRPTFDANHRWIKDMVDKMMNGH